MGNSDLTLAPDYKDWITQLKQRFRHTQLKAAVAVNSSLLQFYWELGEQIISKQQNTSWGDGFLAQLSRDLQSEFPNVKGFSLRNLKYIRQWVGFYAAIGQQAVAQLQQVPWGHHLKIIAKCASPEQGLFYVQNTLQYGWSRAVLVHQLESQLHLRIGQATHNFDQTLPNLQSDLATQALKDPYVFDFLSLTPEHTERELEQALIKHITQFLLELGAGFAYVGKQVNIPVGQRDFFLDLLFYHTQLHCYVVVELKTTDFEPEHAGKLNFYIKAVDEQLRNPGDNPTIGILLCKEKDKWVAEYALSDINKPIGVAEYQLTQHLPDNLKQQLPSVEVIEQEFKADFIRQNLEGLGYGE